MYKFNITYQNTDGRAILKGCIISSDTEDFEEAVKIFKDGYPNCKIKGIIINEN